MGRLKCEACGSDVEVIEIGGEFQAQCAGPDYVCDSAGIGPKAATRDAARGGFINCYAQTWYRERKHQRS